MGNLEANDSTTLDNLERAIEYFDRAVTIRIAHGDTAISLLANSYLCMSRVYHLRREYEEALAMLSQSEALFCRICGADGYIMSQ